jgi:septum formation topological specificity factor MinE
MTTTTITIELPDQVIDQIDARLPAGGVMSREELASLLVTMGLISSKRIDVVAADQMQEIRTKRIQQTKSELLKVLRRYLDKMREQPTVAALPIESIIAMESVIGAAMGTGWTAAAHAIGNCGADPGEILEACKQISQQFDYSFEVL